MYDSAPMLAAAVPERGFVVTTTANFRQQEAVLNSDTDSDHRQSSPARPNKPIEIRKEFPETWLFDNLEFSR